MRRALILNAVDTRIGGVLIRGERGTAKSTAARSLAALLPKVKVVDDCRFGCDPDRPNSWCTECKERFAGNKAVPAHTRTTPFVNLPVSATEDRVVGTLDIEQAIQKGERHFEPGVLAGANRGLLYIDEVNLLDDHVVSAALAVPADLKMRGLEEKAVLREALRDLLPRSIVKRRKQPFVTPIASWFFGGGGARVPPFVEDALSADSVRAAGLFAPAIVERLRRELAASREHSADRLRRELVLMLVLGTQLVHALFVRGHDQPSPRFALPEPW